MAKGFGTFHRSPLTGRYTAARGGTPATPFAGDPMTKAGVARVEAAWKKASEETGAFQRRSLEPPTTGTAAK